MDLSETLLLLAGAVAPDGGRGVGQTLRAILEEAAPFDAAEAVLRRPGGWVHSRLDDGDAAIAGEDLLDRLAALRAPLRLDDLPEASAFPETERRLVELGQRSLLAIPFTAAAPSGVGGRVALAGPGAAELEGAIILVRRFGWAFAGVSLHFLWPVAGMAGRAFELAIALTALTRRTERLEAEQERLRATPEQQESERAGLRQELEAARREVAEALSALRETGAARAEAASHALDLEGVLGQTAAERDAARAEREAARAEAELARKERDAVREALEGRVREAQVQLDVAERDATRLREEADGLRDDLESRRQEADRLRESALAAEREHDAQVRSLRQELEEARAAPSDKEAADPQDPRSAAPRGR